MSDHVVTCPNCGRRNRVPAAAEGIPRCGNCHHPLPWIADAGDDTFAEIAEAASLPVIVDMWAPWCGPCRMVSPALEQLAADLAGQIKLVKVNVDDSPKLSAAVRGAGHPDPDDPASRGGGSPPGRRAPAARPAGLGRGGHPGMTPRECAA